MPNPVRSEVRPNELLTNMSVAYTQEANDFVCNKAFPVLSVDQESGVYQTWSQADFMRIQAQPRANGDVSARAGFRGDVTSTYS
jgi:hypothetical protein